MNMYVHTSTLPTKYYKSFGQAFKITLESYNDNKIKAEILFC